MTVPANYQPDVSTGNGVTKDFPYTFKILSETDLVVQVDGITKTLTTDYAVSGVGSANGGNVTFVSAPADGSTVVRARDMAYERDTDYQEGGGFPAATVNSDYDRAIMLLQQLRDLARRSIALPLDSPVRDLVIPTPEAGKVLLWNAGATALENGPTADEIASAQTYATNAGVSAVAASNSAAAASNSAAAASNSAAAAAASVADAGLPSPIVASSFLKAKADGTGYDPVTPQQVADEIVPLAQKYPLGHISGLVLSNNVTDPNNDIDIAVGGCTDSTGTYRIVLASATTKRLDALWAAGSGNGGLDTGTVADGTYHVFAIKRSDTGVVDVLFSVSATAPTMPASYDAKRRIGSIVRTGGSIRAFSQSGDEFLWKTTAVDANPLAVTVTAAMLAVTVPTGLQVQALMRLIYISSTVSAGALVTSPDETDQAVGVGLAGASVGLIQTADRYAASQVVVRTNISAQVRVRASAAGNLTAHTYGYIDTRGKE